MHFVLLFSLIIFALWIFSDSQKQGKPFSHSLFLLTSALIFPLITLPLYFVLKFISLGNSKTKQSIAQIICSKCGTENNSSIDNCVECNNTLTL